MPDISQPPKGLEKLAVIGLQVTMAAGLLAAWHYATASGSVSRLMLPPMRDVGLDFLAILKASDFWGDLWITIEEVIGSFVIASIAGTAIGFALSRRRTDMQVFEPIIAGLYAIPMIVVYPLYVLFFGLGPESKIALGTTIAFFPIVLSTMSGFAGVSSRLLDATRAMGASHWKTFRYVLLPAAFPIVVAGLRIGFILAFLSIIGGEMLASYRGIGRLIINEAEAMNTAHMYAYIIFLVILSLTLNSVVFGVEALVGRHWRK